MPHHQKKWLEALQENSLQLLESAPEAIIISQNGDHILFVNTAAEKLFGYDKEELIGKPIEILVPKRFLAVHVQHRKHYLSNPRPLKMNERTKLSAQRKDGIEFPVNIMLGPLNIDGKIIIIALIQDISDQEKTESERRLFRTLLDQSSDAIEVVDPETGRFIDGNETAWRALGYTREDFLSLSVPDIDPLVDLPTFRENIKKLQKSKFITWNSYHRRKDGTTFPVEVNIKYITFDKHYLITVVRDMTELRRADQKLKYQAAHDGLTHLPNRIMLKNLLHQKVLQARKEKRSLALLFMDIDRFKQINDTLGHAYGDLLLQQIAPRLKSTLHEDDIMFRIGGDEFAVLLSFGESRHAVNVMEKIMKALEPPFVIEDIPIDAEVSSGIALYPDHATTSEALMQRAGIALNAANKSGNYVLYHTELDTFNPDNLALMGELRHAIEHEELLLYFQPKVNIKNRGFHGVEALIRWKNPIRGLIMPDQFIGLTEQTALIKPLTFWVFNSVLRQCRVWQEKGMSIPVSLNVSARNLLDKKFPEQLAKIIGKQRRPHPRICMEITESAIMSDPVCAISVIKQIKALGIEVAIDDFGKGYSSLDYLNQLPVDLIKIDKSFVINMTKNKSAAIIVKSTINLAHNLGLQVVAEGVENQEIFDLLTLLECDVAQGNYIGKPMPIKNLSRWLDIHTPPTRRTKRKPPKSPDNS